jgi:hypothetical protein
MTAQNMKSSTGMTRRRRSTRGQAMLEYSLVNFLLLVGAGLSMMFYVGRFYNALTQFYSAIFFVLKNGGI